MNGEERQLTEEDLRNMSPEELLELEKKNCLFCNIVSGKIPAKQVYEDDKVLSVLDINPAAPGHMLLMTKEHFQIMPQIPDELVTHLGEAARKLSHAALKGLHTRGTTIFIANGAVAGQRAPHFILHIIPREEGDGVGLQIPEGEISEEENMKAGQMLRQKLAELVSSSGRAAPPKALPDERREIGEQSTKKAVEKPIAMKKQEKMTEQKRPKIDEEWLIEGEKEEKPEERKHWEKPEQKKEKPKTEKAKPAKKHGKKNGSDDEKGLEELLG